MSQRRAAPPRRGRPRGRAPDRRRRQAQARRARRPGGGRALASRLPLRRPLRRPRPVVVVAGAFAAVVLFTSMPVSALLTQHRQLATTSAALARAQAADRSLSAEAKALGSTGTVDRLARTDYGLVPAGQKAYVILPPAGSSSAEVAGSGHVPLEGPPVAPGSTQSQQLLGLGAPSDGATGPARHRPAGSGATHGSPGGFWSRVARTLEFWR